MKVEAGELKIRGMRYAIKMTKDFYIGQTEVTLAQWKAVMRPQKGKELADPAKFKGDELPVARVSAHDAMEFCGKLNESGLAPQGWKFTLPTESQWEYAARGGRRCRCFRYSGSDALGSVAWYGRPEESGPSPVAKKSPNELGLYDMSGNLWEWCFDRNDDRGYALRGGCFLADSNCCRVTSRLTNIAPDDKRSGIGFRVVLVQAK